jgi:hypothetical protein
MYSWGLGSVLKALFQSLALAFFITSVIASVPPFCIGSAVYGLPDQVFYGFLVKRLSSVWTLCLDVLEIASLFCFVPVVSVHLATPVVCGQVRGVLTCRVVRGCPEQSGAYLWFDG